VFKPILKKFLSGLIIGIMLMSVAFAGEEAIQYIFTPSTHKLIVDGQEYANPDIPVYMFIYEDRNYIPLAVFRDLCIKLDVPFEFNPETKEVRITTSAKEVQELENLRELSPEATASILEQNPEVRDTIDEKGYAIWKGRQVRLNKDYLDGNVKVELQTEIEERTAQSSLKTYREEDITIYQYDDTKYVYLDSIQRASQFRIKGGRIGYSIDEANNKVNFVKAMDSYVMDNPDDERNVIIVPSKEEVILSDVPMYVVNDMHLIPYDDYKTNILPKLLEAIEAEKSTE